MQEKLLQYIWQFQYFNKGDLRTAAGEPLQILSPGRANTAQGPDFLEARIRVGDTLWAGSVELHIRPVHWHRHGHDGDPHYDNVVLHVVWENDHTDDLPFPVLELQTRVSGLLLRNYEALMNNRQFLPCGADAAKVDALTWLSWKDRLMAERLQVKSERALKMLNETSGNWDIVAWWLLARQFGQVQNSDLFETLARSLPFNLVLRSAHNLTDLEALLLGRCGMLHEQHTDAYTKKLWAIWLDFKEKYQLQSLPHPVHQFRMRPAGFPAVRLAQLAMLLHGQPRFFSQWLSAVSPGQIMEPLQVAASPYWNSHNRPDEPSASRVRKTGASFSVRIMLNAVLPLFFAYGHETGNEEIRERAFLWAGLLPPENNYLTDAFEQLGVANASALDSQALLQLHGGYCSKRRCLECAVGNALLRKNEPQQISA